MDNGWKLADPAKADAVRNKVGSRRINIGSAKPKSSVPKAGSPGSGAIKQLKPTPSPSHGPGSAHLPRIVQGISTAADPNAHLTNEFFPDYISATPSSARSDASLDPETAAAELGREIMGDAAGVAYDEYGFLLQAGLGIQSDMAVGATRTQGKQASKERMDAPKSKDRHEIREQDKQDKKIFGDRDRRHEADEEEIREHKIKTIMNFAEGVYGADGVLLAAQTPAQRQSKKVLADRELSKEAARTPDKKAQMEYKSFEALVPDRDGRSPLAQSVETRKKQISNAIFGTEIIDRVYDEDGSLLDQTGLRIQGRSASKKPSKERMLPKDKRMLPPSLNDLQFFKDRDQREGFVDGGEVAKQLSQEVFGYNLLGLVVDEKGMQLMPNEPLHYRSGSKETMPIQNRAFNPAGEAPTDRDRKDFMIDKLFQDRGTRAPLKATREEVEARSRSDSTSSNTPVRGDVAAVRPATLSKDLAAVWTITAARKPGGVNPVSMPNVGRAPATLSKEIAAVWNNTALKGPMRQQAPTLSKEMAHLWVSTMQSTGRQEELVNELAEAIGDALGADVDYVDKMPGAGDGGGEQGKIGTTRPATLSKEMATLWVSTVQRQGAQGQQQPQGVRPTTLSKEIATLWMQTMQKRGAQEEFVNDLTEALNDSVNDRGDRKGDKPGTLSKEMAHLLVATMQRNNPSAGGDNSATTNNTSMTSPGPTAYNSGASSNAAPTRPLSTVVNDAGGGGMFASLGRICGGICGGS